MSADIRPTHAGDLERIGAIYAGYVADTAATFHTEAPALADWQRRLTDCEREGYPFLAAVEDGEVAGYAYGGRFRARQAYARTVETSIYLAPGGTGKGTGRALYGELLEACARGGFHLAVAGATLPNPASAALHRGLGFEEVGVFRQVGHKLGAWHDVQWWQKLLG